MHLSGKTRMASSWLIAVALLGVLVGDGGGQSCLEPPMADCCRNELQLGQFYCAQPEIDNETQAAVGCRENGTVLVPCFAALNVSCVSCQVEYNSTQCVFQQEVSCRYVNGRRYNYYVAVALSLFLGMFGIDRFYLGYPALGLVKLCTLGFFFIGQLVDFLLILLQVVGPADQSQYFIPFYGPILMEVNSTDPFLPVSDQMCA